MGLGKHMHESLALMPLSITPAHGAGRPGPRQSLALCSFAAAGMLGMALFVAGLPVVSMCVLAFSGVSSFVVGSTIAASASARESVRARCVAPEDVASGEARTTYRAILFALSEVERALGDAPRLTTTMAPVIARCRAAVELSGRIALLANPLQRYLDRHDVAFVRSELARLRTRAEATTDAAALGAFSNAAAARTRQLAVLDQIAAKRDQVCARLELVHAALDAFAATIVKLHTLDEEQLVLAGESVTDHLDGIADDLEVLESALEFELAA
jgi:hypothetical protein